MSEPKGFLVILTAAAFFIAFPTAVIAWVRMLRAKTSIEYLKSIALFAFPILGVFLLADIAGLIEFPPPMPEEPVQIPTLSEIFSRMPGWQLAMLGAAAITWIIGGNILMFFHLRRTGKRWWVLFNPFHPPFGEFNAQEWSILGGLLFVSMFFGIVALSL